MAANNNIIPNDGEPTRPFFVVQFTNAIKLIPTNYITWKAQIKSILVGYGLFNFFNGTHLALAQMITTNNVATPNPAYATWMRQDQLLYGALVGTLASTVAPLITQADTSHEAWKILEDTYANPSRGHTNLLKEKLKTMTKGTQSVSEFMQQVKGCADLLASLGKKQDPEDIIDVVLKGLDPSFQSVIDGVHARDTTIQFEELHEKLINKELHNNLAAPPSNAPASAMTMHTKPNKNKQKAPYPPSNWSSPPPPSSAWQSPPPYQPVSPQPRPFKPFQGRCQWCRETGHVVGFCPIFRQTAPHLRPPPPVRPPYNPSPQPQAQHNIIQPSPQPWLVDSGASHHVTNDLQNLSLHYPYAGPDELIVGNEYPFAKLISNPPNPPNTEPGWCSFKLPLLNNTPNPPTHPTLVADTIPLTTSPNSRMDTSPPLSPAYQAHTPSPDTTSSPSQLPPTGPDFKAYPTTNPPPPFPVHEIITRSKNNIHKPIQKLNLSVHLHQHPEPQNITQALKDPEWRRAMTLEFDALCSNDTWVLVPPQEKQNVFMHSPTTTHWSALKRLLRYIKGSAETGIIINKHGSPLSLHGYSDADWAGDKDDYISTSGYLLYLGRTPISWTSRKQKSVARSSTEAEYRALADSSCELLWVTSLLNELGILLKTQPVLYCDNMGAKSPNTCQEDVPTLNLGPTQFW
ncbi:hypothetical protein MRB53_011716 [Persea americana]|uniref:Uncharacterized protein n=1 Tax=Persea americana TaxID=3435 RepID=A0ACC2LVM5_PERAE|nr:hypothetical protein MRB53_011716 [Persea americana]